MCHLYGDRENAKEAVEAQFEAQLKNGALVFKTIDISKEENEAIADKYEVTWSSLFSCPLPKR